MPNQDPQARLAVLAAHHDVQRPPDAPADFWPLAYAVADKAGLDPTSVGGNPGDGRAFLDALDGLSGINSADDQPDPAAAKTTTTGRTSTSTTSSSGSGSADSGSGSGSGDSGTK